MIHPYVFLLFALSSDQALSGGVCFSNKVRAEEWSAKLEWFTISRILECVWGFYIELGKKEGFHLVKNV